eukprot:scaffold181903_cov30-Tisochrysis_lutea.AAC.4
MGSGQEDGRSVLSPAGRTVTNPSCLRHQNTATRERVLKRDPLAGVWVQLCQRRARGDGHKVGLDSVEGSVPKKLRKHVDVQKGPVSRRARHRRLRRWHVVDDHLKDNCVAMLTWTAGARYPI